MISGLKNPVSNYLSLIKFSHTVFALPFAIIGFMLGLNSKQMNFNWMLFLLVLLCMVFARSAAMAFNRYIDKDIDKSNPRTLVREIPSGVISSSSALIFVICNVLLFIVTTFFINKICFFLSPLALLIILGYSFTKRFTYLCHFILGLGLSLAPIGAYLAVTGRFNLIPLLYSFAVLFWVGGFDVIYALQDEDFDKSQQLKSIPVFLGKKGALIVSNIFHLLSAILIVCAGVYSGFGIFYWVGTVVFITLLIYQHRLVQPDDLSKINMAFFTTNGIGSVLFSIFFFLELYWPL